MVLQIILPCQFYPLCNYYPLLVQLFVEYVIVCALSTIVSATIPTRPMLWSKHVLLQILMLEHSCELLSILDVAK